MHLIPFHLFQGVIFFFVQGALEMRNKTVEDKYTPLDRVFMLDFDGKLDHGTMKQVNFHIELVLISLFFMCTVFKRNQMCCQFFLRVPRHPSFFWRQPTIANIFNNYYSRGACSIQDDR